MNLIFGFFFLGLTLPLALTRCICNRHVDRYLYPCPNQNQNPVGFMYSDELDDPCLPVAKYANPPPEWGSVIYQGMVVYLQLDYNAYEDPNKACEEPPDGARISTDQACHISAYDPTTSTSAPTPTTTRGTTLWIVNKTRILPTHTTQTTVRQITVNTVKPPASVSTKCDHLQVLDFVIQKLPAYHPSARSCPDGSNGHEEALILASCSGATGINTWIKDKQVITDCNSIPRGEPIGLFVGAHPLGVAAIFWECTDTAFKIAHQDCGKPVELVDVETRNYAKEMFYTFSW